MKSFIKDTQFTTYPLEILKSLLLDMYNIEQGFCMTVGEDQDMAYLVIASDSQEEQQAEEKFRFKDLIPEIEEEISTDSGTWEKQVFIFCDAGDGVIFYRRR